MLKIDVNHTATKQVRAGENTDGHDQRQSDRTTPCHIHVSQLHCEDEHPG
jgi:hypothetical protein